MLQGGCDLSRKKIDVCRLDDESNRVDQLVSPPNGHGPQDLRRESQRTSYRANLSRDLVDQIEEMRPRQARRVGQTSSRGRTTAR